MEWFKVYTDWNDAIDLLTDEEAGQMLKAVYAYVLRGEKRSKRDRLDIFLSTVYHVLSRDREKFDLTVAEETQKKEELRKKRIEAGRKGAILKYAKEAHACTDQHMQDGAGTSSVLTEAASVCHDMPDKNKNIDIDTNIDTDTETEKDSEREKEEEKDGEGEEEYDYCSEPPSAVSELPVEEIPLNDGRMYPLFRKDVDEYARLYPAVDIGQELRNIRGWCMANPERRKTKRGVNRFINGWLSKAQDKGGRKQEVPENPFLAYARGEKKIGDWIV